MTSSFTIKKINEQRSLWTPALPGATLGGLEDRYLKIVGECHPDFNAVPIGNPDGAKLCVRKTDACGLSIGDTMMERSRREIDNTQGYYRGSVNLYDVREMVPYQQINPEAYSSRRIPWEGDLVRRDYLHRPLNFGGIGINPVRIPHQLFDEDKPYWSYDFTFTPREDPLTGKRIATSPKDNVPPPKYDITQLHQRYPVAKREAEYVGNPYPSNMDTVYFNRNV